MEPRKHQKLVLAGIGFTVLIALAMTLQPASGNAPKKGTRIGKITYNEHIRPILSENCFHCHGPDAAKREADLALHDPKIAFAAIEGMTAIVPGNSSKSEVVHRIFDEDDPMPPEDSNRSLTSNQKNLLKRWIEEGAIYEDHWAFVPPTKPEPPSAPARMVRNPIDNFIQSRLSDQGLKPSPEALPEVLARRATLALTGLQPSPEQLDSFISDQSPDSYEEYIDRLLDSDAYAERMALYWLDAARYADTDGYQNDSERTNWPWRDWVIQAYRDNMPFDQFTIEQIAGDMLPEATHSQRLASAFNRNHRQNAEGGALAAEFLVENVIDRVETTSTIWLGLTTGCARCHDHKYDPISQREFFQLYAYFNNIGEKGIGQGTKANPILQSQSPLLKRPAEIQRRIDAARASIEELKNELTTRTETWAAKITEDAASDRGHWVPAKKASELKVSKGQGRIVPRPDGSYFFEGQNVRDVTYTIKVQTGGAALTGIRIDALPDPVFGSPRKLSRGTNGNFVVSELKLETGFRERNPLRVGEIGASFQQKNYPVENLIDGDPKTGWAVLGGEKIEESTSLFVTFDQAVPKDAKFLWITLDHRSGYSDHNIGRFRILTTTEESPDMSKGASLPRQILSIIKKSPELRNADDTAKLRDYYQTIDQDLTQARVELNRAEKAAAAAGYPEVPVMIMSERPGAPLPAYLLDRGQYDAPVKSEALPRGVIQALLPGNEHPDDRLEFARWLVSRENPITARVTVNLMWQRIMGTGLVKTSEDFGSQGELPSNPELLDWLAIEFMESGWDVKKLYRLILTSHTFRQSSKTNAELTEIDPENRLLARGPRYRMDGFAIRDLALNAAGLLNPRIGGPPVKPYQPEGLWAAVAGNAGIRYTPTKGGGIYRKSMYSYWKRAVNPPRQTIFDASGREICNVRRRSTNTPLQALALMNDRTFIEAARLLAQRIIKAGGPNPRDRLTLGYRLTTGYTADEKTLKVLRRNLEYYLQHFENHPEEARDFLSTGSSPRDESISHTEHAAYTATAHLILNLDETITLE